MNDSTHRQLPLIRLRAEPVDETAQAVLGFKYADPLIGKRHQIGGSPTWLQGEEVPKCPNCHHPMTFYGQLDSIGDQIVIADCGLIYVFLCFDCFQAKAVVQSF